MKFDVVFSDYICMFILVDTIRLELDIAKFFLHMEQFLICETG